MKKHFLFPGVLFIVCLLLIAVVARAQDSGVSKAVMIEEIIIAGGEDATKNFRAALTAEVSGVYTEETVDELVNVFTNFFEETVSGVYREQLWKLRTDQIELLYQMSQDPDIRQVTTDLLTYMASEDVQRHLVSEFAPILLKASW